MKNSRIDEVETSDQAETTAGNFGFTEPAMVESAERAITDKVFPGMVCGVWKDGKQVAGFAKGYAVPQGDPDVPARPMTRHTVFDLASLTKPLSTAILVMKAVDSGDIRLDDPLARFLPQTSSRTGAIALGDLLTHTGGLPAIPALERFFPDPFRIDRGAAISRLLRIAPERAPGQSVVYSCAGFMLLGLMLERVSGLDIGALFRREIAAPMELSGARFAAATRSFSGARPDCGFAIQGEPPVIAEAAPTEFCVWRGRRIAGQVHDESSWCLGGLAGNAGLFSALDDVAAIASLYLREGASGGRQVLSGRAVRLMTTQQTDAPGERRSLGLRLHDGETQDGPAWPSASFGHTGFTGTSVFMDPGSRLMAVILTNRVYYGRAETALKMPGFRREFHKAVWRAFGD